MPPQGAGLGWETTPLLRLCAFYADPQLPAAMRVDYGKLRKRSPVETGVGWGAV